MPWTLVQASSAPGANSSGATAAPSLPSASAQHNLLVAGITNQEATDTVTGPSGWTRAVTGSQGFAGTAAIWYRLNNPGGITTATWSDAGNEMADSWMAEFSDAGVSGAALDSTGTGSDPSALDVTATASSANAAGDLGIAVFGVEIGGFTWPAPSGWTVIGSDDGSDIGAAWLGYQLSVPGGTLSVTSGSSSSADAWAGALATFTAGPSAPVASSLMAGGQSVRTAASW